MQNGDRVGGGRTLCTRRVDEDAPRRRRRLRRRRRPPSLCRVGAAVAVGDVLVEVDERSTPAPRQGADARRRARPRQRRARSLGPISPRSSSATAAGSTRRGPTPWIAGDASAGARPGRTSPTSSTPARSSSTGRWSSPPSAVAEASTISSPTRPPTGWSAASARSTASCSTATAARCVVASYDYTVLAGTQGTLNHRKKDRLFELAAELRLPVVLFTEGGGGRPGDSEAPGPTGLDCLAFLRIAELSGLVPARRRQRRVLLRRQRRPARLLRRGDRHRGLQHRHGRTGDDRRRRARRPRTDGDRTDRRAAGQRRRRHRRRRRGRGRRHGQALPVVLPGSRRRVVVRRPGRAARRRARGPGARLRRASRRRAAVRHRLGARAAGATSGSASITALARLEGRPVGVLANNPRHLGGAIDSPAADKAARFMQLCDAFDLPLVMLVDTPGMMVGPDVEATALVRHCNRLFVTGANLSIPTVAVVLRKAYGLGAQAMMGGSTKAPLGCFAWPTSEFGGMGLEGAVRLGYRRELDAAADEDRARAAVRRARRPGLRGRQGHQRRLLLRDRRRHRPRRHPPLPDRACSTPRRRRRRAPARSAPTSTPGDHGFSSRSHCNIGQLTRLPPLAVTACRSAAEHGHPLVLRRRLEDVVLLADRAIVALDGIE